MTGMLTTISAAISAIAGISLLVGVIGVMNIMLVSDVYKRQVMLYTEILRKRQVKSEEQFWEYIDKIDQKTRRMKPVSYTHLQENHGCNVHGRKEGRGSNRDDRGRR